MAKIQQSHPVEPIHKGSRTPAFRNGFSNKRNITNSKGESFEQIMNKVQQKLKDPKVLEEMKRTYGKQ